MHFELKTQYSFNESMIKPSDIDGFDFCAITDNNACAHIKFQKELISKGIKPIFGIEIETSIGSFYLYAKNKDGYTFLLDLISESNKDVVFDCKRNLNVACVLKNNTSVALIKKLSVIFETYLSVKRTHNQDDLLNLRILHLSKKYNIGCIAVNNCRFKTQSDCYIHDVRYCISTKQKYDDVSFKSPYTNQQYLKSKDEMLNLFADLPNVIENTLSLANEFNFTIETGKVCLPKVGENPEEEFIEKSKEGFESLEIPTKDIKEYRDRLNYELDVICSMGFASYFLIVADFIGWSKCNNIPVGPGRGSGAGSLVAYALGITDIDPIKYGLMFERFLNPDRVSMPDFDIDFCQERRGEVIEYVANKWGRDKVAQIINFGTIAARAAVNDVNRVLSLKYNDLSKNVPAQPGTKLSKIVDELFVMSNNDDAYNIALENAVKIEGTVRQRGVHAAGVVIAPSKITDFCGVFRDDHGNITHLDMGDVEAAGLVKFDFLGLKTLTTIDKCLKLIDKNIDINKIPLDDKKSFDLLRTGLTNGVFQLENSGMQNKLIKPLQPDTFEEMIAMVALYRPGPMQSGMMDSYINRKFGREEICYPLADAGHDSLRECLEPTYGVIIYQEQVMKVAQILAGYSLGQADLLRRAMGKKKPEEMEKQRKMFADGVKKVGIVSEEVGVKIFDAVEKFAGYGFNKSHSAAYALIAYQTLWLKANYPLEFFCATMNTSPGQIEKFIDDCRNFDIEVLSPCINRSRNEFSIENGKIRCGFEIIKGVGEDPSIAIMESAPYKSPEDFFMRCTKYDKRIMEALVESRVFPKEWEKFVVNQTFKKDQLSKIKKSIKDCVEIEWNNEHIEYEFNTNDQVKRIGRILCDHPVNNIQEVVNDFKNLKDFGDGVYVFTVIEIYNGIGKKSGKPYTKVTLDDTYGSVEVFPPWGVTMERDIVYIAKCNEIYDEYNKKKSIKILELLSPLKCKSILLELSGYVDIFSEDGFDCLIKYKDKLIRTNKKIKISSNSDFDSIQANKSVKSIKFCF